MTEPQNCFVYRYLPKSDTCVIELIDEKDKCERMISGIINRHYPVYINNLYPQVNMAALGNFIPARLRGTGEEAKYWNAVHNMYKKDAAKLTADLTQRTLFLASNGIIGRYARYNPQYYRQFYAPYYNYNMFGGWWPPVTVVRPQRVMARVPGFGVRTGTTYRNYTMHNIPFTKRIKNRDGYDVNVTIYIVCETDDGKNCFGKIYRIVTREKLDNDPVFCQNLRRELNIE